MDEQAIVDKAGPVPAHRPELGPCWVWRGKLRPDRRGVMVIAGKDARVSRVSWELHTGSAPGALFVLHKCDNPECVRPEHLFLGTQLDNVVDMDAKGRRVTVTRRRGENGNAHLTEDDVSEIRELYALGVPQPDLSRSFGTSQSTISRLVLAQSWTADAAACRRKRNRTRTTGVNNFNAKLNPDSVRQMRSLFDAGSSVTEIASKFGVAPTTAKKVAHRLAWRHVAEAAPSCP
jgi:hypothetical protein